MAGVIPPLQEPPVLGDEVGELLERHQILAFQNKVLHGHGPPVMRRSVTDGCVRIGTKLAPY